MDSSAAGELVSVLLDGMQKRPNDDDHIGGTVRC
jgi:hypothetical protein